MHEAEIQLNGTTSSGQTITINSAGQSGITFTLGNTIYSSGDTLVVKMVEIVETGGTSQSKFWRCTDSSGNVIARSKSTDKNELGLSIEKDESIDSYEILGSAPIGFVSLKFRDGFSGG